MEDKTINSTTFIILIKVSLGVFIELYLLPLQFQEFQKKSWIQSSRINPNPNGKRGNKTDLVGNSLCKFGVADSSRIDWIIQSECELTCWNQSLWLFIRSLILFQISRFPDSTDSGIEWFLRSWFSQYIPIVNSPRNLMKCTDRSVESFEYVLDFFMVKCDCCYHGLERNIHSWEEDLGSGQKTLIPEGILPWLAGSNEYARQA